MQASPKWVVGLIGLSMMAGCASHTSEEAGSAPVNEVSMELRDDELSMRANQLRTAPTQITVDGINIIVKTRLTRQYNQEGEGSGLQARFDVQSVDHSPLPNGLHVIEAWVMGPVWVWEADVNARPTQDGFSDHLRTYGIDNGPRWLPGSVVDAVVRLKDSKGNAYLLREDDAVVQRVDPAPAESK